MYYTNVHEGNVHAHLSCDMSLVYFVDVLYSSFAGVLASYIGVGQCCLLSEKSQDHRKGAHVHVHLYMLCNPCINLLVAVFSWFPFLVLHLHFSIKDSIH